MGTIYDRIEISSQKDVRLLGRDLQDVLAKIRASSVDDLESNSGALGRFDDKAAIEVVARGKVGLWGAWAVQVYVWDRGADRNVELVALGDSGGSRVMGGYRNTLSLPTSVEKRDAIAARLRQKI